MTDKKDARFLRRIRRYAGLMPGELEDELSRLSIYRVSCMVGQLSDIVSRYSETDDLKGYIHHISTFLARFNGFVDRRYSNFRGASSSLKRIVILERRRLRKSS